MTDWRHHYQTLDGFHEEANDMASARCPFHEDRKASLRLNLRTGWAECFAGCGTWGPTDFAAQTGLPAPSGNGRGGNGRASSGSGDGWISYVYTDPEGRPLFRVSRTPQKGFPQSHWDGRAWQKGLTRADGTKVTRVLYRLQALAAADPEEPVWLTEGEKDADNLASLGLVSTTFAGGAGKSPLTPDSELQVLAGRRVYVLPDHDKAGEDHAAAVLPQLHRAGAISHLLDTVRPGKDVSDWLAAGGTRDALVDLAAICPPWAPPTPALTLAEAAQFAGVHSTTLLRAVQSGSLPATAEERPQGTRYTVARTDLDAWITSRVTLRSVPKDAAGTLQGDGAGSCSVPKDAAGTLRSVPKDAAAKPKKAPRTMPPYIPPEGALVPGPGRWRPCEYNRTDLGNAELLRDLFRDDLRYCPARNCWFIWTGQRWQRDDRNLAGDAANQIARLRYDQAGDTGDAKETAKERHWGLISESAGKRKACLDQAAQLQAMMIDHELFDEDPYLLNCRNGTIDLRTGALRPHRREDLLTKLVPVPYDPDATCPLFLGHLDTVFAGDQDLVAYLVRALGYSLTGLTVEEVFFLLFGTGRNGKGTITETVASILGNDYCRKLPTELLMEQKFANPGPTPEIARLRGARFTHATESNQSRQLDEGFIKEMTGGDRLTGRYLHENPIEFIPSHKLWFATNHKPKITGTDEGIWSRVHFIPFQVQIPEGKRDRGFKRKLLRELPGILALLVRGCLDWQDQGLNPPDVVRAAKDAYRLESDVMGRFLEDRCILSPRAETLSAPLRNAYEDWARDQGEKSMTASAFGRALSDRGLVKRKSMGLIFWSGIGLVDQDHPDPVDIGPPELESVLDLLG